MTITYEKADHIAQIGLNRPEQRNAFSMAMFKEFAEAITDADDDPNVRCTVIYSAAEDFTVGLDLQDVVPHFSNGTLPLRVTDVDPWEAIGRPRTTPLITAVHGRCFTVGTELALASDICIAGENTRFGLREVRVGIFAAGGACFRFAQSAGWVSAMRYVLTGDDFDAAEAYRLGVVTEVVASDAARGRALELAQTVASRAPLAVQTSLAVAKLAFAHGPVAALRGSAARQVELFGSSDFQEGVAAFLARRPPVFRGN